MPKEMVISATPHETRVAILEEGQLCEIYVEREKEFALVGSIYKGRVTRVLPGMQSAFVDIGLDSDAFLYVSDFLEDIEEFDHIVTTVEDKVEKMQEQGGQPFAGGETGAPVALEPADVETPSPAISPAPTEAASGSSHREQLPHPPQERRPDNRPSERPRFEGRGHGRDNRFGRGGRRGRGRRGRDRRFGPELPSSKYASRAPEPQQPEEPAPAGENFTPIVLPGESLAKYKSRPPAPVTPSTPAMLAGDPVVTAAGSTPIDAAEPETRHEVPEPRIETPPPAVGGLEPLPGESISRAKPRPELEQQFESPSHPEEHEEADIEPEVALREEIEDFEEHIEPDASLEHGPESELSEEEAKALSEHVADVQLEEVERAIEESEAAAREMQGVEAEGVEMEESGLEDDEDDFEAEEGLAEIDNQIDSSPEVIVEGETTEQSAFAESGIEIEPIEGPQSEADAEHGAPEAERMAASSSEAAPRSESQPWKARVSGDYRGRMQHPARRGRDRGRRDDRGRRHHQGRGGHRPQPRRPQLISELLKQGQEIIVQIAKEPLGKKGARITSHIALPGRFLVYMPTLDHTGVSRKISSAEERSRLRRLVTDSKGQFGGGFIVRTAAEGASDDEIRMDVEFLTRTWAEIKNRGEQRKAPTLLHRDLNLVERILRDYLNPEFTAIWVDTEEEFTKVVEFVSRFQPNMTNRVKLYGKETPIFEEFGIQQEIDKGLRPKVWLKSGGYIVINHTEALVAIDVNTGKFVGRGSTRLEDTIVRTNVEAVKEIVRQMRLRDLGGIIIIDFIDMEERRNREKVMAALEDALKSDRAPSKVLRFNEFGLVAITRKRTKQALERTLCQPCPYCTGSGMVKSVPTLCYEIQAEAHKMAPEIDAGSLTLRVHPEIAKALKTRESALVEELEHWTKKSVIIQADPTLHWEQYDIY